MRLPLIVSLLILATLNPVITQKPLGCFLIVDSSIKFNLNRLQKESNYLLEVPEEFRPLTPDPQKDYKLTFNFCTNPTVPSEDCLSSIYSMGYLYTLDPARILPKTDDLKKCLPVTDRESTWLYLKALDDPTNQFFTPKFKIQSTTSVSMVHRVLQNEEGKIIGIRGIATNLQQGFYNFEYEIRCPTESNPESNFTMKILDNQDFKREGQSPIKTIKIFKFDEAGCGRDFSGILKFLEENPWIFAIVCIVAGFFLVFFGFKFLRWALAVVGGLVGFVFTLGLILWFWNYKGASSAEIFFVLAISLLVGLISAYVFYSFTEIGVFCAGGFLGFLLANLAITLIEGFFNVTLAGWIVWTIIIVFVVCFILLGKYLHDFCVILATSTSGSYLLVRGVGTVAGEFPDSDSLITKLSKKELANFPWQWWAYIGAMVGLLLIGLLIQFKQRKNKKKYEAKGKNDWKKGLMNDDFYD